MELNVIKESFERIANSPELSSQELIDHVIHEIKQALQSIESDNDSTTVLTELKARLRVLGKQNHSEEPDEEVDMVDEKVDKIFSPHEEVLEKMLFPDISNTWTDVDFDHHTVNQIIISHFYREGLFDVADCLINEACETEPTSLRLQFQEIHSIVKAVKANNIIPAINWISANQERFQESNSHLKLKLYKIPYVETLQKKDTDIALMYAKSLFAPLASHHMKEIQKLICSILWAGRLENSPYADFLKPIHQDSLPNELFRAFCNIKGQPCADPLKVSVAAGGEALSTLLKTDIMVKNEELDVELGKEFQFHSVFVCPVTCNESSQENPAMMLLPCGHCLCKETIDGIIEIIDEDQTLNCPFCKMEPEDFLQLYY